MTKSKLLVSGLPGCGKTTLVEKLLTQPGLCARGFVTREIRESGHRVGFRILGLSGAEEVLAHTGIESGHRVGKYHVDIRALEKMLQSEFGEGLPPIAIIDEIGKMELLSQRFRSTIRELWDSDKIVVATVMSARNALCDRLKTDKNTVVHNLNHNNRDQVLVEVKAFVQSLMCSHAREANES